ncbi:MAG: type II toxin-antitoxin system RelE/ParE family toxin [Bacteroidetes bacterium]|nr:type II toxin-antitoxin system RelE/ParE family toxin [Bacteroidota bacterium]
MIVSFGDKETGKIWSGVRVRGFPTEIQEIGRRKLRMLNNSQDLNDLKVPPSNRMEKLKNGLQNSLVTALNSGWVCRMTMTLNWKHH